MSGATRRSFLTGTVAASGLLLSRCGPAKDTAASGPADVTLRIGTALADIAKDHTIGTIGYNGAVPRAADPFARGCTGDRGSVQ